MEGRTAPIIRVFGGVAAHGAEGPVDLGSPKQRAVLATLVIEPGAVVSLDRIVDTIWGDRAPARAEVSVRGYVSNLRTSLAMAGAPSGSAIVFRERGYVLELPAVEIDMHRFDEAVRDGVAHHRLGQVHEARDRLVDALAWWTGPPFGAAADELGFVEVVARLEQRRGDAVEALTDVRLTSGEHAEVVASLPAEIARHPYREGLRVQYATALYRAGRPVDALRSLDEARRVLAEDVGVEPGPSMRALETAILDHDESKLQAPGGPSIRLSSGSVSPIARDARAVDIPRAGVDPLFGRDAELRELDETLAMVEDGGRAVVVSGEAGIGKTALVRRLRAEAEGRGWAVGWGRCPESATSAPYRSFVTAMTQLARTTGDAAFSAAVEVISAQELRDSDRAPALAPEPVALRLAAHLAVLDALRGADECVLVVIDDLQWADDATLALLEFLAAELDELPLLLAVTVRRSTSGDLPAAVRSCLGELARARDSLHLALAGIAGPGVAQWIGSTTGRPATPELTTRLRSTTDGNPFYLRELLALLRSDGDLGPTSMERAAKVPLAVQDVVRRRLSHLPPSTQSLLATAAVVGRRFDVDVVADVVDLDPATVVELLDPAISAGLVHPDESVPGRLSFSHALVAETLVAEQNPSGLAQLHVRTLAAIEHLRAGQLDRWVDELAFHACAGAVAGSAAAAIEYSIAAADVAATSQASGDVATHLQHALAVMDAGAHPVAERIELLIRLGVARRESGDVSGGRTALVDAALLAESIQDDPDIARALAALHSDDLWPGVDWSLFDQRAVALVERVLARTGPSVEGAPVRAQLSAALAAELVYLDPDRSMLLSGSAVESAERVGDPVLLARVLLQRYWGISGRSGHGARIAVGDRLIELADRGLLPSRFVPLAHLSRVAPAYESGDIETVERCRRRARETAHEVRTPTGWAHLQYLETSLALLHGDLDRAIVSADAVGEAMWRVRRFAAATTRAALVAVTRSEQGRTDEALEAIAVLEDSPYGSSIRWLTAWILAEGGREEQVPGVLASFDAPLPDDWYRVPLTVAGVLAAARVGDLGFLRAHLDDLVPAADRFACLGSGGIVMGPVSFAIAAGAAALGERDRASTHLEIARSMAASMGAACWTPRIEQLGARLA